MRLPNQLTWLYNNSAECFSSEIQLLLEQTHWTEPVWCSRLGMGRPELKIPIPFQIPKMHYDLGKGLAPP